MKNLMTIVVLLDGISTLSSNSHKLHFGIT